MSKKIIPPKLYIQNNTMVTIDSGLFTLACHPQTSSQAISEIDVKVGEAKNGGLMLSFCLLGDVSGLLIPESRSPRRADHLWQHTCFEAFVMSGEGPGYREFNFSPSGEWAVYAFHRYRNGGVLENELSPEIEVRKDMNRLELDAEICQGLLPRGRPLRLGLSAVVEDVDGILSYWALRHPPGKPDFHHTDAFVLQLDKL
jgi:hypothetical protein